MDWQAGEDLSVVRWNGTGRAFREQRLWLVWFTLCSLRVLAQAAVLDGVTLPLRAAYFYITRAKGYQTSPQTPLATGSCR